MTPARLQLVGRERSAATQAAHRSRSVSRAKLMARQPASRCAAAINGGQPTASADPSGN
jgi:hypothetical protein